MANKCPKTLGNKGLSGISAIIEKYQEWKKHWNGYTPIILNGEIEAVELEEEILYENYYSSYAKNNTLEIIKLFASYMVVLIHFYFRDGVGSLMDALARFAVPLFFVVSGFYSYFCLSFNTKEYAGNK